MTITDELRKFTPEINGYKLMRPRDEKELLAIADRIDAAHEEAIASVMNDALYHANDKDMAELGWYRALGADKQPIKFGDEVEHNGVRANVLGITFHGTTPPTVCIMRGDCWVEADELHHVKPPTVEDVLWDMHVKLDEVAALHADEPTDSDERERDVARIYAEYAAKLQLRGDSE